VTDRILVYVDDGIATPRALRRGAGIAAALRAPLLALVVDTPATAASGSRDRRRDLREHLDDAVDLGAEVIQVEAKDPLDAIVQTARDRRITQIVLPHRASGTMDRLRYGSMVDRILTALPDVEVHIVAAARGSSDAYRVGRGD
jgi:two-component system sensor histidine kinase KdpD